jgi:hypothetical protein
MSFALRGLTWRLLAMLLVGTSSNGLAQQTLSVEGRQFPLNQTTPPGTLARWAVQSGRIMPQTFQPVRIHLPSTGRVMGFDATPQRPVQMEAPARMSLLVGASYRFQVDDLPEFPNQQFYPSVELVDHLHPPPGQAERFPVEIELLTEEFNWAASGRLVTKVVYLEQPDRVPLRNLGSGPRVTELAPAQNALAEADALGRPIAIVRLGGRLPDTHRPDPQFWGVLAPIRLPTAAPDEPTTHDTTRPRTMKFGPPIVEVRTTIGGNSTFAP